MARFVVAIDQGTTGTTVLVFDETLRLRARGYREFAQHFPQPGWVEHDPEEIWQSVLGALADALHGSGSPVEAAEVAAIGITNQRETTLVWERATGKPLHNAIVWQDRRTADLCARMKAAWLEDEFKKTTGLVLDPYFSGTKLQWLLDNVGGLRARAEKGEVCFGTVDSYLVWRLDRRRRARDRRHQRLAHAALRPAHARLERAAVRAARSAAQRAARGVQLIRALRRDARRARPARRHSHLRHRRRSTGGAVRPGLLRRRRRQMHLRHRRVHADEHRQSRRPVAEWPAHDRRRGSSATTSSTRSRARRSSPAPWCSGCATASASSPAAREIEALARVGARLRRRDRRARARRPGRAALASRSARHHQRPDARHDQGAPRARRPRRHRAADRRSARRHASRRRHPARHAQGRRRRQRQRSADAVPSRRAQVPIVRPALVETTALGAALLAGIAAGVWRDTGDAARAWKEERRFTPSLPKSAVDAHVARWRAAVERA